MPSDAIRVSARFPVPPDRLYRAWLDGREHGLMTGGRARIDPVIGGRFAAWDEYITGMLLQLDPGRRIVQTWRTTEFPDAAPDSRLEIRFEAEGNGARITLVHSDIPEGDGDKYEDGWIDYYFEPMQRYFRKLAEQAAAAAAKAAPAKAAAPSKPKKAAAKPKKAAAKPKKAAAKPARRKAAGKKSAKKRAAKPAKRVAPKRRPAKKAAAKRAATKRRPARKPAARKAGRKQMRSKSRRRPAAKRPARRRR